MTPRRVIALVLAGFLAATATSLFILARPSTYEGKAIVFVSQMFPPGQSSLDIEPFVNDFETALTLPSVMEATAKQTGVSQAELGNILSNRAAQSAVVEVTYKGSSDATTRAVVRAASQNALHYLAQQQLDRAEQNLAAAKKANDKAALDMAAFEARTDYVDLDAAYAQESAQVVDLKRRADQGDGSAKSQLDSVNKTLSQLAASRAERDQLKDAQAAKQQDVSAAEQARSDAQERISAAESSALISVDAPTRSSRLPALARGAVSTFLVVGLLGVGLLWLLDRRNRVVREPVPIGENVESAPRDLTPGRRAQS
ncbi:MAG: hypothetical protein U0V73_13855 [Acidimicrobiia bacterium]